MTHALAEEKVGDDSGGSTARAVDQQHDTDEASPESASTDEARTTVQGSVPVAGLLFSKPGVVETTEEAVSSGPDSGEPKAAARKQPSRPSLPGELEFEWTGWEVLGFPPEIKAARNEYAQTMIWLAFLQVSLVPSMPDALRPALAANLAAAERMLIALARKPIAVADRFEAIKAIAMWSKAVEKTVDAARRERDEVLAVQARMARELDAAMEMIEQLEAEEAARVEAEAEARRQTEALERQLKDAADRAAAQKLAEAKAKAEAERVALAEAAAAKAEQERLALEAEETRKRVEAEEAERKRLDAEKEEQEKAERERLEAQAARDKVEQERQENARLEAIEQEKRSRRALFGENQAAFDAALAAATRIADADLAKTILALEQVRDEAEDLANKTAKDMAKKAKTQNRSKPKAKQRTSSTSSETKEPTEAPKATVPAHKTAFAAGAAKAGVAHGASIDKQVDKYGALASGKGASVAPEDLAWAIATSNGSVPMAEALVDLCARGEDGTAVAREIASQKDLSALLALCGRLLDAGTLAGDVAKAAVMVHSLDSTSAIWVMGMVGPKTSALDAVHFLERHKRHKLAMLIGAACGVTTAQDELITSVVASKSTPSAVSWLLASTTADFALIRKAIVSKDLNVDAVRAAVEPYVPGFALTAVLQILTQFPQEILNIPAMLDAAPPGLPQMALMRLRLGANDTSNRFTLAAMTTEAQLMAGLAGGVTCTQVDIFYVGKQAHKAHNKKMNARTGFLQLPLMGPEYELHVHWEDLGTMELTSMHVQISRVNGTELNQIMNFFPLMIAEAVAALNAFGTAGGGRVKPPKGR